MTLTRLEKATFVFLSGLIILGLAIMGIQIKGVHSLNVAVLEDLKGIEALTPHNIPTKKLKHQDERDDSQKLNINLATLNQIDEIPKVGKTTAERIIELRDKTGGFSNLSELLGVKGISPKKLAYLSKFLSITGGAKLETSREHKLNLNFANQEELEALPGVGPKLARSIIDTRNKRGTFYSLDDLEEVPGLSEKKFRAFEHLVEVK